MNTDIINREDFLDKINKKNNNDVVVFIHPLINMYDTSILKKDESYVLPQLIDNVLTIKNKKDINNNIIINSDTELQSSTTNKLEVDINPLMYFTSPINSSNFLELVFNISNPYQLNQWINLLDSSEIKLLRFVLNLFWLNYHNKVDDDMDNFIIVNKKIFKKFLNKNIDDKIIIKIVNRLIKNNYGKKIKYISKIKKYLTKYIYK
jgi:hypothetical protein